MLHMLEDIYESCKIFLLAYLDHLLHFDPITLLTTTGFVFSILLHAASADVKALFISFFRKCPVLQTVVRRKINRAIADVHDSIHKNSRVEYEKCLPLDGLPSDKIMQKLRKYKACEYIRWNEGYASGSVYPRSTSLEDLSSKVFKEFIWTNPLHPDLFPDIRRMESEVVRMCLNMFHGNEDACGTTTSGGTESILLCCLAYRELARSKGIHHPVIIAPASAHAAFDKAAHYFSIDLIRTPVDPVTFKADVNAMRRAISKNTCMLVASAPGFPHGIIDPIEDIAALGASRNIPVHVDCCLGGFLLPFMDLAGYPIEPFDFRLPGVTSISCDTHKYGFATKGTSVILYRNKFYRSHQFFTQPDWSGGVYASPTLAGSRSGAVIAVCWATMMHLGISGYVESTRRIVKTARFISKQLRKIPGVTVFGNPQVSVVAFGSNVFDIYRLSHMLSELPDGRGWCLNNLQLPSAVHLCVTDLHTVEGCADRFIQDVANAVEELRQQPQLPAVGTAALYGMCATLPDRSIVSEVAKGFLDACYSTPDATESG